MNTAIDQVISKQINLFDNDSLVTTYDDKDCVNVCSCCGVLPGDTKPFSGPKFT